MGLRHAGERAAERISTKIVGEISRDESQSSGLHIKHAEVG